VDPALLIIIGSVVGALIATPQISQATIDKLQQQTIQRYQQTIEAAAARFDADLSHTSTQLGEQVSRMTTDVISQELELYRKSLEDMRKQALAVAGQIQEAVEEQKTALATGLEAEMKTERARVSALLDTKLADIVSSYVLESLGNKVDLGAQGQYLFAMLEEHKADIKRELTDDA
jgi:phosphoenolpyruvate carboxylase